jgi:hypothetical protein
MVRDSSCVRRARTGSALSRTAARLQHVRDLLLTGASLEQLAVGLHAGLLERGPELLEVSGLFALVLLSERLEGGEVHRELHACGAGLRELVTGGGLGRLRLFHAAGALARRHKAGLNEQRRHPEHGGEEEEHEAVTPFATEDTEERGDGKPARREGQRACQEPSRPEEEVAHVVTTRRRARSDVA